MKPVNTQRELGPVSPERWRQSFGLVFSVPRRRVLPDLETAGISANAHFLPATYIGNG